MQTRENDYYTTEFTGRWRSGIWFIRATTSMHKRGHIIGMFMSYKKSFHRVCHIKKSFHRYVLCDISMMPSFKTYLWNLCHIKKWFHRVCSSKKEAYHRTKSKTKWMNRNFFRFRGKTVRKNWMFFFSKKRCAVQRKRPHRFVSRMCLLCHRLETRTPCWNQGKPKP